MSEAEKRKPWNWPGIVFTSLGLAILVGVCLYTGATYKQPRIACSAGQLPAGSLALAPPGPGKDRDGNLLPQIISVNSELCVVLDTTQLLAADITAMEAVEKTLQTATATEKQAQDAVDAKPTDPKVLADAQAALTKAKTARSTAQASLDGLAKEKLLVLFINGKPSPGSIAVRVQRNAAPTQRYIELNSAADATTSEGKAWRATLSALGFQSIRRVQLGLGDKDALQPRVTLGEARFQTFTPSLLLLGGLGVVLLMIGVVVLGWRTAMLRDRKPVLADNPETGEVADPDPPFSLGRVQMFWWFTLTLAGYLYIWLISGQSLGVLTTGVVTLLGISGASGVIARAIDSAIPTKKRNSDNFIADLVSDGDGIGLHRVQMVIWTLILGGVFGWTVVTSFGFPPFDDAMLLLVGVVNGVYVGFKAPEKDPVKAEA